MAKNTQSSAKVSGSIGVTTGHVAELLQGYWLSPAAQLEYATELLAKVANGELTPENLYYKAYDAGMDTISTADCPRG
tara:strand:- start:535 stop:768 length:234 start_codon:yes stop_codon:yes gene_type:complete